MVLHVGFWYINCHLYYPALVPSEELKKAFKDLATWPKHKRE